VVCWKGRRLIIRSHVYAPAEVERSMTTQRDNIMYASHPREIILGEVMPANHEQYRIEDGISQLI
jgi:hypothetical protein